MKNAENASRPEGLPPCPPQGEEHYTYYMLSYDVYMKKFGHEVDAWLWAEGMAAGTPTSPPRLSPVSLSCHLCFTPTGLLDLQGCKTLCQYDTQTTHGPCMPVLFCIRITGSRSSLLIECWTMLGAAFNPKGCFTDHDTALGNTHIICSHCCFYAAGETLKNHFTVILDV